MCIGTPTEIKRNYGSGLILNIIFDHHAGFNQDTRPAVMENLKEMFDYLCQERILKSYRLREADTSSIPQRQASQQGSELEHIKIKESKSMRPATSMRTAQYEVEIDDAHVLDLFDYLEENKIQFMIGHYELAQSPLKDVFEKIVLTDD
jgi:hypothetical protein